MKIPNFIDAQFVDKNTGNLTTTWRFLLNQLFTELQQNVSEEGFVVPKLSTTDIAKLTKAVDGTLIYDNTTNVLMIRKSGVFTPV